MIINRLVADVTMIMIVGAEQSALGFVTKNIFSCAKIPF
jgi:hypothetical protein